MFLVLALLGQLLFDTAQHVTSVTFILVLDSIKSLTVYYHSAFELIEYYYNRQFFFSNQLLASVQLWNSVTMIILF